MYQFTINTLWGQDTAQSAAAVALLELDCERINVQVNAFSAAELVPEVPAGRFPELYRFDW